MDKRFRVTLLFNANKVYDREVIEGIGEYLQASQCDWDIFLEEEFTTHLDNFRGWSGDGVIADFDNPKIAELLKDSDIPVIGVGGSYEKEEDYPDIPYVATDNQALVELATSTCVKKDWRTLLSMANLMTNVTAGLMNEKKRFQLS
ncbi:hypothetical protein [Vibrio variabilis]|uniref:hypothetical protein n=1 Tax=Vibrio variabilis TaxID=990271 RepID=UPI0023B87940|nr:hypothetical protein [Vibrio variabilis]